MIPDYQSIMLPLLELAGDEKVHKFREAIDKLGDKFELSEEERNKLLPSGNDEIFANRVGWAKTYLKKAGLLEYPKRGYFKITDRGLKVLDQNPETIDNEFLQQYEEFEQFKQKSSPGESTEGKSDEFDIEHYTPEEILEKAHEALTANLADELLEKVKDYSPGFFEELVVDLLVEMGYGGSIKDAGKAIGKSGDEGIDGVIKEDRLGLDIIYVQAKKWKNTVSRPEIQKFAGALQGKNAKKGIFITTSVFSNGAKEYAQKLNSKIVLINGDMLTKLMIKHKIGVSVDSTYEVKKIDLDYFYED